MALTRVQVETLLLNRCGKLLTAAGMDGTTKAGNNADLNDPIGWAVRQCGAAVADPTAVSDTDLAGASASDADKLLDLAELRTLENISGNLNEVNVSSGPIRQDLGQLSDQVDRKIERKRAQIQREYGLGVAALQAGVLALDFVQKDDED